MYLRLKVQLRNYILMDVPACAASGQLLQLLLVPPAICWQLGSESLAERIINVCGLKQTKGESQVASFNLTVSQVGKY